MIPDEAVEAGAIASAGAFGEEPNKKDYAHVRLVLEAAAPHMLAGVWDEGYTTGNAHNGRRDANPYRETKFDPHTAKPNNWV